MTPNEFRKKLTELYDDAGITNCVGVLADIILEHSDSQWDEGNCSHSENLFQAWELLDRVAISLDVNYQLKEAKEELRTNIQALKDSYD